jgi:hypothetical protein
MTARTAPRQVPVESRCLFQHWHLQVHRRASTPPAVEPLAPQLPPADKRELKFVEKDNAVHLPPIRGSSFFIFLYERIASSSILFVSDKCIKQKAGAMLLESAYSSFIFSIAAL